MGEFNTVTAELTCYNCGRVERFMVQFKYGDVWQHRYEIGNTILWGEPRRYNYIGTPGQKLVVLNAVAEDCPHCGAEGDDCEVWLKDDVISEVRLTSHQYDRFFLEQNGTYYVIPDNSES